MKKKFLILYLIFFMIFGTTISPAMASGLKCNKKSGFTVYDEQNKTCINPTENLKYKYNDGLRINSIEASCNKKAGYTQIKDGICYNPKTKLSYAIKYQYSTADTYNEEYWFYSNGTRCGMNCDYDGKNCSWGKCSINKCAKYAGYTQMKNGDCYNPVTKISYSDDIFYKDDPEGSQRICGKKCDIYGKNCQTGACYPEDCTAGFYLEYRDLGGWICHNPKINLVYNDDNKFFKVVDKKLHACGVNCDKNGQNCLKGACYPEDCKKGYQLIVDWRDGCYCYNPQTLISYDETGGFYVDGTLCGKNCDINGRNCEAGVCNAKDCLPNYTKFKDGCCVNPATGYFYRYQTGSEEFSFYYSDNAKKNNTSDYFADYSFATCDKYGLNCKKRKSSNSGMVGDLMLYGGFGLMMVGAVIAAPIYLPYKWITNAIADKQPEIKVNYLEKNRIK